MDHHHLGEFHDLWSDHYVLYVQKHYSFCKKWVIQRNLYNWQLSHVVSAPFSETSKQLCHVSSFVLLDSRLNNNQFSKAHTFNWLFNSKLATQ